MTPEIGFFHLYFPGTEVGTADCSYDICVVLTSFFKSKWMAEVVIIDPKRLDSTLFSRLHLKRNKATTGDRVGRKGWLLK